jgi:hypothetical protein
MKGMKALLLMLLLAALVGCAPGVSPAVPAQPTATIAPTVPAGGEATEIAAPEVVFGRNDDGAFFYGSPDAPVTLTDYADFL